MKLQKSRMLVQVGVSLECGIHSGIDKFGGLVDDDGTPEGLDSVTVEPTIDYKEHIESYRKGSG